MARGTLESHSTVGSVRRSLVGFLALGLMIAAAAGLVAAPGSGHSGPKPQRETATFAAGCFWSMEAIFKQLKGVVSVTPGYAGGKLAHPSYEQVETGTTGHAESLNIAYDPKVITYRDLLEVLLTVRDPTTLNKQGNDEGPQYRSIIFYRNDDQRHEAKDMIARINESHMWPRPIVTEIQPYASFYRAEEYHMDYYRLHPNEPYCRYVVAPEVAHFRARFKAKLKN